MSGKINNEWELTDEEIARATSLLNAQFAKERKQNTSLLDRGMFGTQNDVNRRAYEAASMSYDDFLQGDTYEDLAKRYSEKGKMAMDDTIGKVAARTGGIASSYATQAGQQAYGDWMTRLEETARAMYDADRQEAMDRYALSKDVLDMRNSAEDRRLALEDRLRKQSQEDEAKQEADYTALQDDIYEAAYNGTASWEKFQSRAEALGMDKTEFLGIAKQARDEKHRDDENANAIDPQSAISQIEAILANGERDENGNLLQAIPNALIKASGLDPITLAAYEYAYANQKPTIETLDMTGDEVVAQLQSGNINERTLATYEELYGESYTDYLIRTMEYAGYSEQEMEEYCDLLTAVGREKEADKFNAYWLKYHGGTDSDGNAVSAMLMKDRRYTLVDNGGFNAGGGINRNAVIEDESGTKYELNQEFIEKLAKDSFDGDVSAAKKWIKQNQEKWGVNTKWFKKE